jgi:hypothetical protein
MHIGKSLTLFPDDLDTKKGEPPPDPSSPMSFKRECFPHICQADSVIYCDIAKGMFIVLKTRGGARTPLVFQEEMQTA